VVEEAIKKAQVLIEALPYIKRFHKKIIVIKYGGSILDSFDIRRGVLEDIVFLNYMGLRPVLVHGAGPRISERMRNEGKKAEFVEGMRVTDFETIKIVQEELEKLNTIIVREITDLGAKATGINPKNKNVLLVEKKKATVDLGLVGEILKVSTRSILDSLEQEAIAVVLPLGRDQNKKIYNCNADEAAASISASLGAEKLVLLTNVKGIMRNTEDRHSFISSLTVSEARDLIKDNIIQQGMIPKVEACIAALHNGVKKTHIIDARIEHSLLLEIFTDTGIGTEITKDK
jgi:acetylglutamate kinase